LTNRTHLEEVAQRLGMPQTRYWIDAEEIDSLYGQFAGQMPSLDFTRSLVFITEFSAREPVNLTTPRDMATFFRLLRDDELISPLVSWRLKHILATRIINDRLPALLPGSTEVIHKTGNLINVLHDAGIIESPGGPVIAVALSQAATDIEATTLVEQRLGLLAFEIGQDQADPGATPIASPMR
jgi:beta-lactamase class A